MEKEELRKHTKKLRKVVKKLNALPSIRGLNELSNVPPGTIQNIVNGKYSLTEYTAPKILPVLDQLLKDLKSIK